jgi:ABC-type multidrug transport system ATPase subunit
MGSIAGVYKANATAQIIELSGSSLNVAKLPLAAYKSSYASWARKVMLFILPFYLTFGVCYAGPYALQAMVLEREKKLVEGMRMMGLRMSAHYMGWFLTFALMHVLAPAVTTVFASATGLISNSNLVLVWVTLTLHLFSVITITFALAPLLNKAKSAQGMFWLPVYVGVGLYMGMTAAGPAGSQGSDYEPLVFWLGSLICFAAAPFGLSRFVMDEIEGRGLTSITEGNFPLIGVWGVQLFDIFLYAAIGWYLDHVVATASGNTLPWNFIFKREFWIKSSSMEMINTSPSAVVEVCGLSKTFPAPNTRSLPVQALQDLSFEMKQGDVTALLGQNGAGKSTAIGILTGLNRPTSGHATVYGRRVPDEMEMVQGMTGVCPQHDLLFDDLTVQEHFDLFGSIKGVPQIQAREQGLKWMKLLQIEDKLNSKSRTLSGGQKRKLSVSLALLGDPKFVLLDEPTAGMDPHSRRAVWDLVKESKAGRTVLLTTHFMDEADALADKIVIISGGTRCALGTPSELKAQYGAGYHLRAAMRPSARSHEPLTNLVQKHVPTASLEETQALQVSLILPTEHLPKFGALFDAMDGSMDELEIEGYGISLPSMQEVFLSILDKEAKPGDYAAQDHPIAVHDEQVITDRRPATLSYQFGAMMRHRANFFLAEKRTTASWLGTCAALVVAAFLLPAHIGREPKRDPLAMPKSIALSPEFFSRPQTLPYFPSTGLIQSQLASGSDLQKEYSYTPEPISADIPPNRTIHWALSTAVKYDDGALGAFGFGRNATLLYNSSYRNSAPAMLHLMDQALIDVAAPGLALSSRVADMPQPPNDKSISNDLLPTFAPLLYMFATMFLSMGSVNNLAKERFSHTKQLLLLSGLDIRVFWLATLLTDFLLICFITLVIGMIAAAATTAMSTAAFLPFTLILLASAPGMCCFGYLISAPFKKLETVMQAYFPAFFFGSMLPSILASALPIPEAKKIIEIVTLLFPPNQIITGIRAVLQLDVYFKEAGKMGKSFNVGDFFVMLYDPLSVLGYGDIPGTARQDVVGPLLPLIFGVGSGVLFGVCLYFFEIRKFAARSEADCTAPPIQDEDEDVVAERTRVGLEKATEDVVKMVGLRKEFKQSGATHVAVENMSLGVERGTCFALLGPNGAGKTTTINMLTRELLPTAGKATICGLSTATHMLECFKLTGFCPQFEGLYDILTCRQHVTLFLRLQGLRGNDLVSEEKAVLEAYGLMEHADKETRHCSGGTRRKLSAAIALSCTKPQVSFLDEPTTGVDVGTRRFIWDRIQQGTRGRVILLTTHYMDEADALAQRIGIMAAGRLAVLGSPQHLKLRHGGGYHIELKGKEEAAEALTKLIHSTFSRVKQLGAHGGSLSFEVAQGFKLAHVFRVFETAKETLGLEQYTLTQTTLEDVFLNIASKYQPDSTVDPAAALARQASCYDAANSEAAEVPPDGTGKKGCFIM